MANIKSLYFNVDTAPGRVQVSFSGTQGRDDMDITFKRITEARSHLLENGYAWAGYGPLTGCETYATGPLLATIKKVPFAGYCVSIR
jgi:hypothetical protein